MKSVLVWDVPTRLFHWLLAASFVGAWVTAESDEWLPVHTFLGYLMFALIGFRAIWGLIGGRYARFSSFAYSPGEGVTYLSQAIEGCAPRHIGHNPAGAQAIFLLLGLGLLTALSGLFVQGGEEQQGMVAGWLGYGLGKVVKEGHEFFALLMLLVVLVHAAGVIFESWLHRENLARAMVTGQKQAKEGTPASHPHDLVGAVVLMAVVAFGMWWFAYALEEPLEGMAGHDDDAGETAHVAFVGGSLPSNAQWNDECGSCHLAFQPWLLPARSWQSLMAQQNQHFGEDLALEPATVSGLLAFAETHSAEKGMTEAAWKIGRSVPDGATPLRMTETAYWQKKHREIDTADWQKPQVKSRSNCVACHQDAEAGTYEDGAMRLPK